MAGPVVDVHVDKSVVTNKPAPWNLTSPESAVRSYLAWTSYAYRIGQSDAATATMSSYEGVRVDSYVQYNIEKKQLIDQKLNSITFGQASAGATNTLLPAKESWTYSYVSIDQGNPVVGGPYDVSYDSTYTVIKNKDGNWIVDSVKATPQGKVK